MSADNYQPFAAPRPASSAQVSPPVTARHQPVTAVSPARDGFQDWGKGAEFRHFQRQRAQSVTTVTAFSGDLPWAEGLNRLLDMPRPHYMPAQAWDELLFDCLRFCRDWGPQAASLGWTELDLFGCNRNPRAGRLDNNGLIITLRGKQVLAIDDRAATIDAGQGGKYTYRRGWELPTSVPLWIAYAQTSGP